MHWKIKNMITVIWKDHKRGHFIQKVRMNADQIDEIYRYTGRNQSMVWRKKTESFFKNI